jgi:hypothetical protein
MPLQRCVGFVHDMGSARRGSFAEGQAAAASSATAISARSGDFLLDEVELDLEILDDEVLPVGGVFPHVECQEILDRLRLRRHLDGSEPHVGTDEMLELVGRDLTETLEAGDLRIRLHLGAGALALLVGIAVAGLLFLFRTRNRGVSRI